MLTQSCSFLGPWGTPISSNVFGPLPGGFGSGVDAGFDGASTETGLATWAAVRGGLDGPLVGLKFSGLPWPPPC